MFRGVTVTLYERTANGKDEFNNKKYTETPVAVKNVLIEPLNNDDVLTAVSLYGKKATCRLCIPKGDTHNWEDSKVVFMGHEWHTFGFVSELIDDNVPLKWNKKIMVERYG